MGVVIGFVWAVIGYVLMQTSIQVWAALMLPNPVERARQRVMVRPYRSLFVGLAIWAVSMGIGGNLVKLPGAASIIGYLLMAPMLGSSVVGGAAIARIIGGRIRGQMRNDSEMVALVGGAFSTTLATLLPVIGWFVFLPIVGFISIGAGALGILSKKRVAEEPQAVAPAPFPVSEAAWSSYQPQQPTPPAQGSAVVL